jgi:chromosome partitioning protein
MAVFLSVFNNKGGVGKTTYMYHIGHILAENGKKTLLVDCDSQCNLTAYCLDDDNILKSWESDGNSIYQVIDPVYQGIGDFRQNLPVELKENLYLVPGDLKLSIFEDRLGDTWNSAKGGSIPELRPQIAIFRYLTWCAESLDIDIVMIDLGPNLGALNRSILGGTDYFITPLASDLFSIQGTQNLGNKLQHWAAEWRQIKESYKGEELNLPSGKPKYLGYVIQQHNVRNNATGMTKGWKIFADRIDGAIRENLVEPLSLLEQVDIKEDYNLGKIPNLHSLIPYSLEARKPVFHSTSADGLTGEHITKARNSRDLFNQIISIIDRLME